MSHQNNSTMNMKENPAINTTPTTTENNVHTFLIIPGDDHSDHKDAKVRSSRQDLPAYLKYLKDGGFAFIPIIGKYENSEQFQMVFNITIPDAILLAQHYPQEFFILGIKDTNGIQFDLYVYNNKEERYEIVERQEGRLETKEAGDIITTTVNNKSISIPYQHFNEACLKFNTIINEAKTRSKNYSSYFNQMLNGSMDDKRTSHSRYLNRCLIYKGLF